MITLTRAEKATDGSDILTVYGTDENGAEVSATGWISATTNYYPPSDYGADGHLIDGAEPHEMSPDELRAYCQGLLDATVPPTPSPPSVITFGATPS